MGQKNVYFQSNFSVTLSRAEGWTKPFRLTFFASSLENQVVAEYDGTTYHNCHVDGNGNLVVEFNNHNLGLGALRVGMRFYDTVEDYANGNPSITTPYEPVRDYEGYVVALTAGQSATITTTEKGEKGDKGDQGDVGPQGSCGPQGEVGPQGPKGDKGDQGETGAQGPKGDKGDKGDTGAQGIQGPKGDQGAVGPQGAKGDKGDQGETGAQGPKGDKGDKGDTGAQGIQGPKGDQGAVGPQGAKGDKGDQGETGAQGPKGNVPLIRYNDDVQQVSYDEGSTWQDVKKLTNNLRISEYIGVDDSLPTDAPEGTIVMQGPTYTDDDTTLSNPIYRMWIYAHKAGVLGWHDNGVFNSISAGVVQETGDSATEVMSQKAVTEKLTELEGGIRTYNDQKVFDPKLNGKNIIQHFRGKYFYCDKEDASKTIHVGPYKESLITEVLKIPSNPCTIYGLWGGTETSAIFPEIILLGSNLEVVTPIFVSEGFNENKTFLFDPSSIEKATPYFVCQSQGRYINIDTTEKLSTGIMLPALSPLSDKIKALGRRVDVTEVQIANIEKNIDSIEKNVKEVHYDFYAAFTSFNLFNKQDLTPGYVTSSNPPTFNSSEGFLSSSLIPVKEYGKYCLYIDGTETPENLYIRFVDEDNNSLMPYNITTGKESSHIFIDSITRSYIYQAPQGAKFAQFTVQWAGDNSFADNIVFAETDERITEYTPYFLRTSAINVPDYLSKDSIQNKANLKKSTGKNLFDKEQIINGYYINTSDGVLVKHEPSAVSGLIPVKSGEIYYLHRHQNMGTHDIRCVGSDKVTPINVLFLTNGEWASTSNFSAPQSTVVKIPDNAHYLQFTCKFSGTECGYNETQFEKGETFTGYEPYIEYKSVPYSELPMGLSRLSDRVDALENMHSSNSMTVNISNSDKIGFFSNSFLNGYCMLGKHAINNLSMFSDYIMYNYGHSGDDILELLDRVNSNEKWLGDVPVQDWGIKYGIIAMQDNEGALFAASSDTYYENAKKLANAIKALGGTPILSTEHDSNNFYYNFTRLANDYKLMFMNWGATAAGLFKSVFKPFWYNAHPATRTAWMWTYGMKPYIDSLPRPEKSIKLFRVRPSIDTIDVQNLMYEDLVSRASIYEEITCGVSGLTEATEKYFDRIDTGNTKYVNYKDEYQILQSKSGSVNFGTHALIEGILPYDKKDCKSILCKLVGSGITSLYIKKVNGISNPLPAKRYVAFGITEGSLSKGQQFQITGGVFNDNILGTYTVEDVVNNVVVTTTSSSGKTTSGTDNPTTNITGVVLKGSYDYPSAEYMLRYNKPLGEWVEVEVSKEIDLTSFIGTCMDFDKVSLLAVGENISISDIEFVVTGSIKKENGGSKLVMPLKGTSLLTNTTFNDSDTEWNNLSALDKYIRVVDNSDGYSEPLPKDISTVRIMNKNQSLSQAIQSSNIQYNGYETPKLQLKIIARYFPEYINSDDKWATSKIRRGSYDCANLVVKIAKSETDKNPVKIGVIPVGIWWNEFTIDTFYFTGSHIVIESENDNIQIAKCDLIQVV